MRTLAITAVLTLLCSSLTAAEGQRLELVTDAGARAVIVIPQGAPHPVRFAADEIREHVQRMSGAELPVVHSIPNDRPAIALGEDLAGEAGMEVTSLERDGYAIKTVGSVLYIAGVDDRTDKSAVVHEMKRAHGDEIPQSDHYRLVGDEPWDFERGTLYGAYHFLETLGVRWFFPGERGTVIPDKPNLTIDAMDLREEPHFAFRVQHPVTLRVTKEKVRNGWVDPEEFEYLGYTSANQKLWSVRMRASSKMMAYNHRPDVHRWNDRFGKEHPEYFALMENGERDLGPQGASPRETLSYTSEGMLKETIADMKAFFSGQSAQTRGLDHWATRASVRDSFSLTPNDGLGDCYTPESQALIRSERHWPYRHGNYIWSFVDKAARAVIDEHPDKKVVCLAYQSYMMPPEPSVVERLPDNVIVGIAALSGPSNIPRGFAREGGPERMRDLLESWDAITSQPFMYWSYWNYVGGSAAREHIPMIIPHVAQDYFQMLAEYGRYVFSAHRGSPIGYVHLNRYVTYRLLWDPDLDMDKLIEDYCRSYYGPAGDPMLGFTRLIEQTGQAIAHENANVSQVWDHYLNHDVMDQLASDLEEAKQLAAGTPYAERVTMIAERLYAPMRAARDGYIENVKALRDQGADVFPAKQYNNRGFQIDGRVEGEWGRGNGRPLYSNQNGDGFQEARVITFYNDDDVFIRFSVAPNELREEADKPDYIELFFDPDNDQESYHWLMVDERGEQRSLKFPHGPAEPPLPWSSDAEIAMDRVDGVWHVEIRMPFASLGLNGREVDTQSIGFLGCVTRFGFPGKRHPGHFCTTNPVHRGSFHQPSSFGRLQFRPRGWKQWKVPTD